MKKHLKHSSIRLEFEKVAVLLSQMIVGVS
jgi:hypothetical protein